VITIYNTSVNKNNSNVAISLAKYVGAMRPNMPQGEFELFVCLKLK